MSKPRHITETDILDYDGYAAQRPARRAEMVAFKQNRRLAVGPNATLYFESYETMLYQIQEMLHIERGGAAQLADELAAYDPLVPKGGELVCTFMLEYADPAVRAAALAKLGGIEETISLELNGDVIAADFETDVERTTAEGKTSSIHFLHFRLSDAQVKLFRQDNQRAVISIEHPNYSHMAVVPEPMRAELARDL